MRTRLFALLAGLGLALAAQEGGEGLDSLFGEGSPAQVVEAQPVENPEAALLESQGLVWGGELFADLDLSLPYAELPPADLGAWGEGRDRAALELGSSLHFDARPDRNYRVYGSLRTDYPFDSVAVKELFADFNFRERVFFRFGKQTMAWGLSRFYQLADPLSLGVKDPEDPTAELEGPVGLKVNLPLGSSNLGAYVLAKDSYAASGRLPGLEDLGYGIKGDFFLPLPKNPLVRDSEITAALFYQRRLAPKAIAGLTTSLGEVQLFSDQVLSLGSDAYRLEDAQEAIQAGTETLEVSAAAKDDRSLFYSASLGAMYLDKDLHLTLYAEYFYNGQGSLDPDYAERLLARYLAEQTRTDGGPKLLSAGDLLSYNGRHNTGLSLSLSELFGEDKLSPSLFWQANWVDRSGMVVPSLVYTPWKRLSLDLGCLLVYGPEGSEFLVRTATPAASGLQFNRFIPYLKVYLGAGKF